MEVLLLNTSVKRVPKNKLELTIDDYKVEGWTLQSQNENVAIMTKPGGWGSFGAHLIICLLTFWFTIGIGNLIYALYIHYKEKSELQIKADLEES